MKNKTMAYLICIAMLSSFAFTQVVNAHNIKKNAITSKKIKNSAVSSKKIKDSAVSTAKIENEAVTNEKIATGAVDARTLADGAVDTAALADGAVDTAALADGAVDTAALADGAVDTAALADGAVDSAALAEGAVDTTALAVDAVDTAAIAVGAVDAAALADGSVGPAALAGGFISVGPHDAVVEGAAGCKWLIDAGRGFWDIGSPLGCIVYLPLHLPHGAAIQSIACRVYDGAGDNGLVQTGMQRLDIENFSYSDIIVTPPSVDGGQRQTLSANAIPATAVIDNSLYSYRLFFIMQNSSSDDEATFSGCVVAHD